MDPQQSALEDLVRQKRIEEIYALRRSVEKLDEDIARGKAACRIRGDPRAAYIYLVKSYVRSLRPLLAPDEGEESPYWTGGHLGGVSLPDGNVLNVVGLKQFLTLPLEKDVSYTVEEPPRTAATGKPSRNMLDRETTRTETVPIPRRIAEKAFEAANAALQRRGLEIDPEDTTIGAQEAADDGGIGV